MSVQFSVVSQYFQQGRHALVELGQEATLAKHFLNWPRLLGWASLVRGFGFKHPAKKALGPRRDCDPFLSLEVNHCRCHRSSEGEPFFVADP